jgi:hypothetical protein
MTDAVISQEDARRMFDELGHGPWEAVSLLGTYAALQTFTVDEAARRLHQAKRNVEGRRTRADKPIPAWVAPALFDVTRSAEGLAAQHAVGKALQRLRSYPAAPSMRFEDGLFPGPARELLEALLVKGEVPQLSLEQYQRSTAQVAPIEARFATLRPRACSELRAFFRVTRKLFHALDLGEPTARALALLCAARGIEPITVGMNKARQRWDERLGRWRREMDTETPDWRSAAIAWRALGRAA